MILEKLKKSFRRRPKQLDLVEYVAKLKARGVDPETGVPVPDPTPLAPPIGYKKHPSMVEIVRDMVRSERLAQEAAASGHETFEESEDFDVGDEPEQLRSKWENQFDPPLEEILKAGREVLTEREKHEKARKASKEAAGKSGGAGGTPPAEGEDGAADEP